MKKAASYLTYEAAFLVTSFKWLNLSLVTRHYLFATVSDDP